MNGLLIIVLGIAVILGLFAFVCFVVSSVGWSRLAEVYRARDTTNGESFWFRSARVGPALYRSCLVFTSGPQGLRLDCIFPFLVSHPPLFIPWSDISASECKVWLSRCVDFHCVQQKQIRIRMAPSLALDLIETAGNPIEVHALARPA